MSCQPVEQLQAVKMLECFVAGQICNKELVLG